MLLPFNFAPVEFVDSLKEVLSREYQKNFEAVSAVLSTGQTPFQRLKELFSNNGGVQYLEHLVDTKTTPDTIIISDFDNISSEQQKQWMSAVDRWALQAKSTGSRKSLLTTISRLPADLSILPQKDVRLRYYWWPGPSALEVRLALRHTTDQLDPEDQWREYLIPSIAGADIDLALSLYDTILQTPAKIIEELKTYGLEKGWKNNDLSKLLNQSKADKTSGFFDIGIKNLRLWSFGVVTYTPEYGEEIHSAALTILGREEEILHRLWRGQSSLALPLIDYIRLKVAEIVRDRYPSLSGQYTSSDGSYIDLGALRYFFDKLSPNTAEKREWGRTITTAHRIRNNLAHYQLIQLSDFRILWNEYDRLRRVVA